MSHRILGVSRFRLAAAIPATLALAVAGIATGGSSVAGAADATADHDAPTQAPAQLDGSEYYMNYVAPRVEEPGQGSAKVSKSKAAQRKAALDKALEVDAKYAQGNPVAARGLAKLEQKALKTGKSPAELKSTKGLGTNRAQHNRYKKAPTTQEARLLTILVEFNENANDDFTNVHVPTEFQASDCKLGDVQNGPLHNNLPDPATFPEFDNNTMWVDDFSSEFYNKLLFTDEGITERVRTDLTGPDGKPGFDISGYTMKSMYEEMSHGAYTVTGSATPWVKVPHSEAYYGASVCHINPDTGEWEAGAMQDMQGHPDNPLGPGQLPIDAVQALAEQDPDFPWSAYDIEDQGDRDGDGNYHEPDGVIDHVVLVHAGADKSGGGGQQGTYAIWAHSSAVAGGAPIPGTDLKLSNYIVQPEDSGVGVFAHEYGHDLGLPDLYDTSGAGDSDLDFWDLMSSGSHSGPIFQSMPTHMGLWDKWVLGWADPKIMNPGDRARTVRVGQNSRPMKGTEDGVIINLPNKDQVLTTPHSGELAWWTGNDQNWADIRLSRSVDVPDGTDVRFWMWNDYIIESDWDFGFVEVSTDGGETWEEQKVYNEAGDEVTTPDGYSDPNGRMADFGGKKYGLTGSSDGWAHHYVDLSAYAGTTIDLRLRMATDAAFEERGWFADDFSVESDGETVWSDDVESGANGWTNTVSTWVDTTGPGWRMDPGSSSKAQYYLVEWRNLDGFDEGLKYAYDTTYSLTGHDGAWKVEKIAYNAPGMLVSYRDTSYTNNHITAPLTAAPSAGAKGMLLIVDSHFDPLRRSGANADLDPSVLKNLPSRPQSSNAAFSLHPTYEFNECQVDENLQEFCNTFGAQAPVKTFTDTLGWVPGIEARDDGFYYRDADASTVVPSRDNQPYTTRIVHPDGSPATEYYGLDFGFPDVTGTGNPGDSGVAYGTKIQLKRSMQKNTAALIRIKPPAAD